MHRDPIHRGPTMIALRARRQGYSIANQILNPHIATAEARCKRCRADVMIVQPDTHRTLNCPHCGEVGEWPDDYWLGPPPLSVDCDAPEALIPSRVAEDVVRLTCLHCGTTQWFAAELKDSGIWCARCDTELIPPAEYIVHRRQQQIAAVRRDELIARNSVWVLPLLFILCGMLLMVLYILR